MVVNGAPQTSWRAFDLTIFNRSSLTHRSRALKNGLFPTCDGCSCSLEPP